MDGSKFSNAVNQLVEYAGATDQLPVLEALQTFYATMSVSTPRDINTKRVAKFYADVLGLMVELNREIPRQKD
jgi:hypothetical protein